MHFAVWTSATQVMLDANLTTPLRGASRDAQMAPDVRGGARQRRQRCAMALSG
jgi:hypothetical protein